jgi:hypothetical protein
VRVDPIFWTCRWKGYFSQKLLLTWAPQKKIWYRHKGSRKPLLQH